MTDEKSEGDASNLAVEVGTEPSAWERIAGIFFRPRRTFERMSGRPRFVLPLVILLVAQTGLAFVMFQSGVVAEHTVARMEDQGRDPREIEAVQSFFDRPIALLATVATAPFVSAIGVVIGAALLFFMANLMMGARLRFTHYLSAFAHASLIQIVDSALRVGLILANRTFDVRLGAGALFGDATGFGIRVVDTLTDPLFLWGNAICAIGVSAYAKRSFRFGALAVLPGMILATILSANR